MVHQTKTDSELMTKQKENKTDFLLSPHSVQSITSTIAGQIRKQPQKVERRAWGKKTPKNSSCTNTSEYTDVKHENSSLKTY